MFKRISKVFATLLLASQAITAMAEKDAPWITNMDEAQRIAKAENKDIFMFFTGSDWCGWCIKLDNEVLHKDEFMEFATENYVLVELDFPMDKEEMSEEQIAHNDEWKKKITIPGYPTVVLTDANATPYAKTGYKKGGPEGYVEHLKALKVAPEKAAKLQAGIESSNGHEKAVLIDELLNLDGALVENRKDLFMQVIELANKDSELYKSYAEKKLQDDFQFAYRKIRRDKELSDEQRLTAFLDLKNEFGNVKSGNTLTGLMYNIGNQYIKTGQLENAKQFMINASEDQELDIKVRAFTRMNLGFLLLETEGMDVAQSHVIAGCKLSPELDNDEKREKYLKELNQEQEKLAKKNAKKAEETKDAA